MAHYILSDVQQAAALVVPGLRGLLGALWIGPLDALVTLACGTVPYLVNDAMRQNGRRATNLGPLAERPQITAASRAAAERSAT
jgi:hypothetical protein